MELDLRQIIKETKKSAYNGHTIKKLEQWKKDLKELDSREDKKSLKDCIMILELVIELKKSKKQNPRNKMKQVFLFTMFLFLLVGISAEISQRSSGNSKLIVGENVSISTVDINITDNSIINALSYEFTNGSQIREVDDSLVLSTGINGTIRTLWGVDTIFPITTAQQLAINGSQLGLDNRTTAFLGDVINIDDIDSFSRFQERNINNGTSASAGFSAVNDVGVLTNFGIGSSNFILGNESLPNQSAIVTFSPKGFHFINAQNGSWKWRIQPSTSINRLTIAELEDTGNFTISGNYTGEYGFFNELITLGPVNINTTYICDVDLEGGVAYNSEDREFYGCRDKSSGAGTAFEWKKLT